MAVTKDVNEFKTVWEPLDLDFALGALYSIFQDRLDLDLEDENMSTNLTSQQDAFRIFLYRKKIVSSLKNPKSAVVSPE